MQLSSVISAFLLVSGLIVSGSPLSAQSHLKIVVRDSLTGEGLPFANVQTQNRFLTTADADGFFTLTDPLPDSVFVTYVGYRPFVMTPGSISRLGTQEIRLAAASELPTVEITLPANTYGPTSGVLTPSVMDLVRIPAVLGEVDLLKSLTLMPGISGGGEGRAALNIRGGNPNQTDLLVDGNRVYNVNHLGGYLSAVPAYGVKAVTVYKGGVPAQYGGRLSGVVDIVLREGRRDKLAKTVTLGLGTVQAGLEGPSGQTGSFLVNGRYSYPTTLYNLTSRGIYRRNERGNHQTVGMYDFVGKYGQEFGAHKITFSAFVSGDNGFKQEDNGHSNISNDDFRWGNNSLALLHQYRSPGGGVWATAVQFLRYRYSFSARQFPGKREGIPPSTVAQTFGSQLHDFTVRSEFSQPIGRNLDLKAGIHLTRHLFRADVLNTYVSELESRRYTRRLDQDTVEVAAYTTADLRLLGDRLNLMIGLRASGLGGVLPGALEPRLRLAYNILQEVYLNASLDRHHQYIHQLTPEVALYPNELYLLADERLPAERSDQVAVGLGGLHGSLQWSVEAFRKRLDDLVRIRPGEEQESFITRFPGNVVGEGAGRVKGLELYVKRDAERFSYSLAYTLSRSERRYAEIDEGNWFPFTFDRRHDLSATVSKALGEKWRINASFVYQTGHSFTAPIYTTAFFDIYGKYNRARLSPFHVLNLSATKAWRGRKRNNRYHSLTFSVYNAYNRVNAYSAKLVPTTLEVIDPVTGMVSSAVTLKVIPLSLLPILPGINYTVTIR